MIGLHVLVGQGVGGRDTLLGVENEHFRQEVDGVGLNVGALGKTLAEWDGISVGQGLDKTQGVFGADGLDHVGRRRAQELCDDGELVDVVTAGEKRLALDHLGQNAPDGPEVHLGVVLLPRQHDLRRSVVPRGHVAGHLGVLDSGQAEVADLEVTVLVDQDVQRLQVTVDHARRVHVLEASQDLVREVLDELFLQGAGRQQAVEVCALQLGNKVDVLQRRQKDIVERDQVLMAQVLQQLEFSVGSLGQHRRGKRFHDLLHRHVLSSELIDRQAHEAKSTHAHGVEIRITRRDLEHGAENLSTGEFSRCAHEEEMVVRVGDLEWLLKKRDTGCTGGAGWVVGRSRFLLF